MSNDEHEKVLTLAMHSSLRVDQWNVHASLKKILFLIQLSMNFETWATQYL